MFGAFVHFLSYTHGRYRFIYLGIIENWKWPESGAMQFVHRAMDAVFNNFLSLTLSYASACNGKIVAHKLHVSMHIVRQSILLAFSLRKCRFAQYRAGTFRCETHPMH